MLQILKIWELACAFLKGGPPVEILDVSEICGVDTFYPKNESHAKFH